MAILTENGRPTQRQIEGVLEDLDNAYRNAEDCEDTDELQGHINSLHRAIATLTSLAAEWEGYIEDAYEEEEEEDEYVCRNCGRSAPPDSEEDVDFCDWCRLS